MDYSLALKNAENSLRDFIEFVMTRKYGADWYGKSGLSTDCITKCIERQAFEKTKIGTVVPDERLTYYMNFNDIKKVVDKSWDGEFKETFGNKKRFDVYWDILADFRNPEAHRRELLPHHQHMIEGISGEIRTLIIMYRSKLDEADGYFPRIESARDSLGNTWVAGSHNIVDTKMILRPGDILELNATASDPEGEQVEYCFTVDDFTKNWSKDSSAVLEVGPQDIGLRHYVTIYVRSSRHFHASSGFDDKVTFLYQVLPQKQ